MATADENALTILRILRENSWVEGGGTSANNLKGLVGLDDAEFDLAEKFLLAAGYMGRLGSGDSECWITALGMDYVKQEMSGRLPLSLDAEAVLRYVQRVEPSPQIRVFGGEDHFRVDPEEIKSSLNLSPEDLAHALQELEDEGLARCSVREQAITSGWGIRTTPEGRQAIRRSFRVPQAPVAQIGAIFHGPVNATNLVNAISSQIEQTISSTDPEAIRQAITETLGDLTRSVADVLDPNQRELYTQAAAELQKELEKSDPDPTIVQKLMRILSFGDTLDGALELGTKALAVSAKVAPYIYILYEGIRQLTGLIG